MERSETTLQQRWWEPDKLNTVVIPPRDVIVHMAGSWLLAPVADCTEGQGSSSA